MPDVVKVAEIEEPWIEATILTPDEYLGSVLKLCQDRRGSQKELTYVGNRAMVKYELPLNEVVFDFYDRLKSVVEIEHHFIQWQLVFHHGPIADIGELFFATAAVPGTVSKRSDIRPCRCRGFDPRLLDLGDASPSIGC